ncbi:MAG: dihydroorotate dehydrogenase [Thaumarchaeota archaeon]|nr:dihydroorotate dehydrogenase [Nitrososphaerota archaeon]
MVDISVAISSLKLENPTLLASGILGISPKTFMRIKKSGAGGIVTKSIGLEPNDGYSAPTLVEVEGGYLNAMGLPNPGCEAFSEELREADWLDMPIIVSVFGSSPEELAKIVDSFEDTPCQAYELNLSCPHVSNVGVEVGSDPRSVYELTSAIKQKSKKPLFVKVSPMVPDVIEIAKAAEEAGADGITAVNTIKGMAIDLKIGRPILHNRVGGLSGPALKPVAIRCVYELYKSLNIPIIGCGGVTTWEDAIEFFMVGATAVQVGTAIASRDLIVFQEIVDGIIKYLEEKGHDDLKGIIGIAHKR